MVVDLGDGVDAAQPHGHAELVGDEIDRLGDAGAAEGAEAKKKRTNPLQFFGEVKAEARKITWTSRKETIVTSIMVAIMVVMAAAFFFIVDVGLSAGISGILRLAAPAQ